MDSHLLVTPAIFKPGSTALKAFGFPIKALRHDEKGETLDGRLYIFFPSLGGEGVFFATL